jgi:hypothetical protein
VREGSRSNRAYSRHREDSKPVAMLSNIDGIVVIADSTIYEKALLSFTALSLVYLEA